MHVTGRIAGKKTLFTDHCKERYGKLLKDITCMSNAFLISFFVLISIYFEYYTVFYSYGDSNLVLPYAPPRLLPLNHASMANAFSDLGIAVKDSEAHDRDWHFTGVLETTTKPFKTIEKLLQNSFMKNWRFHPYQRLFSK